jgi:hypothetical protein
MAAARQQDNSADNFNPTFSATVGSVTSQPHNCLYCHKQYASNAKLLQHQRKKHCVPQDCLLEGIVKKGNEDQELKLVTVSGDDLNQLIQQQPQVGAAGEWRTVETHHDEIIAAAGMQEQPPGLEYRMVDGEVLQLTRVPQAEAMRLVNSGATVIHVPADQEPADLGVPGPSRIQPSVQVQQQPNAEGMIVFNQCPTTSTTPTTTTNAAVRPPALNTNHDLPAELVQVLVNQPVQHQQQPDESNRSARSATRQPQSTTAPRNNAVIDNSSSSNDDWINAYRRQQNPHHQK